MSHDYLTCEEVLEQLFAFLDEDLDLKRSARIEQHLQRCRDCFSRAEFEKRLRQRVRETGTAQAPERLRLRVRGLLEKF